MRSTHRAGLAVVLSALLLACTESKTAPRQATLCPTLDPLTLPTAVVRLTVGGNPPVFRWTPDCLALGISVVNAHDLADSYWAIGTPAQSPALRGPITYGVVPEGVTEFLHTRPLVAGTAYLVLLSMPLDTNVAYIAASESFVAP